MNDAELARITTLRGNVLRFLASVYPSTVANDAVLRTFYEYEKVDDIEEALAYMVEKGYVERREFKAPFDDMFHFSVCYKATAKGIDLHDGTLTDPGVFFTRR